jgi:hypothetical protein
MLFVETHDFFKELSLIWRPESCLSVSNIKKCALDPFDAKTYRTSLVYPYIAVLIVIME